MSNVGVILLPEYLRNQLGEQGASELVTLINETTRESKNSVLETAADRFERRLSEFKGEVKAEIHEVKSDIIKWMFIFWLGQIGAMLGIFSYFK